MLHTLNKQVLPDKITMGLRLARGERGGAFISKQICASDKRT